MMVTGELYMLMLTHSKEPSYPLRRKLVGAQSHPGPVEEVKDFLPLLRFQLACGLFTILCYPGTRSVLHITNQLQALKYSTHMHTRMHTHTYIETKICKHVTKYFRKNVHRPNANLSFPPLPPPKKKVHFMLAYHLV